MALSLSSASIAFAPTVAPIAHQSVRTAAPVMETLDDLKAIQSKSGMLGYWNPTPLAEMEFWGQSQEASIGFLRQAELKHGRVAMAAFVGFCVQSNGICFPWNLQGPIGPWENAAISFADISAAGSPLDQWDALPTAAKLQIILAVGFFEWWGENTYALEQSGMKHYMRGGKPGTYPSFNKGGIPHPVPLELWDPFGFTSKMSPETKERKLLVEINNGRAAMLGIMGFVAAAKGCIVPVQDSVGIPPYAGQPMAPFAASDDLPYVADMIASKLGSF